MWHLRIGCCCVNIGSRETRVDTCGCERTRGCGVSTTSVQVLCHLDLSPLNGQGRFPEINVMDNLKCLFIHEILRGWRYLTNQTDVLDAFPIIMVHAVQIEAGRL